MATCLACTLERDYKGTLYKDESHTCSKNTGTTTANSASAYTFDNYQQDTGLTAIYPNAGEGTNKAIDYCVFGLVGEAGSIANAWKKNYRDYPALAENDDYPSTIRDYILRQIGDVLWYADRLATELGTTLGEIATDNIRKLNDRKQRGKLSGSGDNR